MFIAAHKKASRRAALLMKRVGTVLLRRARFLGRFIYWTWMHGTPKHAVWVCHHEGLYW